MLHKHGNLPNYQFSKEQAEVWAVKYGGLARADNRLGTAQGAREDKAQPQCETVPDSRVCLCKAGSSRGQCRAFMCVYTAPSTTEP